MCSRECTGNPEMEETGILACFLFIVRVLCVTRLIDEHTWCLCHQVAIVIWESFWFTFKPRIFNGSCPATLKVKPKQHYCPLLEGGGKSSNPLLCYPLFP